MQPVLPGHPRLEKGNSLRSVHRDRPSSRGGRRMTVSRRGTLPQAAKPHFTGLIRSIRPRLLALTSTQQLFLLHKHKASALRAKAPDAAGTEEPRPQR